MAADFELFHRVSDTASARVRRYIVDHQLEPFVRFRNVEYDEVQRDFLSLQGTSVPALWDGSLLIQGADAVIARLAAYSNVGRVD